METTFADAGEAIAWNLAVWMRAFFDGEVCVETAGDLGLELSTGLRCLAIIAVLSEGNQKLFKTNLEKSGEVRALYLKRLSESGGDIDHHQVSARTEPLFDSIASGNLDLCRKIVKLSTEEFHSGREYEDDYCYAQIIHGLLSADTVTESLVEILARFESYLEGGDNPRYSLCKALITVDQKLFDESFRDIVQMRQIEIDDAIERGQMEDAMVISQRRIFVEGLAILALADYLGLESESEYLFCPALARMRLI